MHVFAFAIHKMVMQSMWLFMFKHHCNYFTRSTSIHSTAAAAAAVRPVACTLCTNATTVDAIVCIQTWASLILCAPAPHVAYLLS